MHDDNVRLKDLMSIRQTAIYMELSTQWVYHLINQGLLKATEVGGVGGQKMITKDEADRYMSSVKKTEAGLARTSH